MKTKEKLPEELIWIAYEDWAWYSLEEISEALGVSERTLERSFERRGLTKPKRPKLVYFEEAEDGE